MLLDPLEEQLDLPAALVKRGDDQCGQSGIVGQKHQRLAGFRVFETDAPVVAIQLACTPNEQGRQVFPDAPIAPLVGVGQRRTPDWRAKAHAVQLRLIGQQTGFDVAQTLAVSQLREGHGAELLGATQAAHSGIAAITHHNPREAGPRYKLHELREQRLAQVHRSSPEASISGSYSNLNMGKLISNRHQIIYPAIRTIVGL